MNLALEKLYPKDWSKMAEAAHLAAFLEKRPADMDRTDYALLVHNHEEPYCYATIIEVDKLSAYMQHGGAFGAAAKGPYAVRGYRMIMDRLKSDYQTVTTKVLNKNKPMLKMALSIEDFDISGCELNGGDLFVYFLWKKH